MRTIHNPCESHARLLEEWRSIGWRMLGSLIAHRGPQDKLVLEYEATIKRLSDEQCCPNEVQP